MPPRAPHTDAQEFLARVVERYAGMSSYADTGVVRQWFGRDDPPLETRFSTLFKKPSRFRFEFRSPHPFPPLRHIVCTHVVGSDGGTAYSLTKQYEETASLGVEESLSMAIAGATGISAGSAHSIGRLLVPEVTGFSLLDLFDAVFEGETEVDGTLCWTIRAKRQKGSEMVLGIEKGTLLLRRCAETLGKVPSEELRENIRLNGPLDDQLFAVPKNEI